MKYSFFLFLLLAGSAHAQIVSGGIAPDRSGGFVLKAGDTMTGQLTIAGSSLTVGGNAFSVGGSTSVEAGGNWSFSGGGTFGSTITSRGVKDGSNACSGCPGEVISANAAASIAVGASASVVTVATITIHGDFDVTATMVFCAGASTAVSKWGCYISLTAGNIDAAATNSSGAAEFFSAPGLNGCNYVPLAPRRINVSVSTPVYLSCRATYTVQGGATWDGAAFISARRMR